MLQGARLQCLKGVTVLHTKGTPYELGYQHGYLLAEKINLMINRTLLGTAAYVAAQTDTDPRKAMDMLRGALRNDPLPGACPESSEAGRYRSLLRSSTCSGELEDPAHVVYELCMT